MDTPVYECWVLRLNSHCPISPGGDGYNPRRIRELCGDRGDGDQSQYQHDGRGEHVLKRGGRYSVGKGDIKRIDRIRDGLWRPLRVQNRLHRGRRIGSRERVRGHSGDALCGDGPTAAGSPSVNAPVQVAGNDGTNIQNIKTDTSGEIINNPLGAATAQADGATNTPTVPEANGAAIKMPTYPFKFNSSTWDKDFACTNQANITVSSGTSAKIISGVASTQVRICHISISSSTAADFTIQQGTGSVCGSSTVSITGTYKNVTAVALDFQPTAALRTTVAASDVCVLFGATVTAGGTVIYAQY